MKSISHILLAGEIQQYVTHIKLEGRNPLTAVEKYARDFIDTAEQAARIRYLKFQNGSHYYRITHELQEITAITI